MFIQFPSDEELIDSFFTIIEGQEISILNKQLNGAIEDIANYNSDSMVLRARIDDYIGNGLSLLGIGDLKDKEEIFSLISDLSKLNNLQLDYTFEIIMSLISFSNDHDTSYRLFKLLESIKIESPNEIKMELDHNFKLILQKPTFLTSKITDEKLNQYFEYIDFLIENSAKDFGGTIFASPFKIDEKNTFYVESISSFSTKFYSGILNCFMKLNDMILVSILVNITFIF